MKLDGYYSSGQFAKLANVSVRTIRFYDTQNLLKPSRVTPSGARFYTDSDLVRLQQILLFKYLGFSLDDIREINIHDTNFSFLLHSLKMQKRMLQDRMEQMQLVADAIENIVSSIEETHTLDASRMLNLIHLTGIEKSLKTQYQNASNINARIRLHKEFSTNKQGWFPWIYEQCKIHDGMKILELGCGNGALWSENKEKLPKTGEFVLSDISDGMLRDARRNLTPLSPLFSFEAFDCCHKIPHPDCCFDLVIANHLLFYCTDLSAVCSEVKRVLKPNGIFLCSTYGSNHMKEISSLVRQFDSRIVLSAECLYERFGLENGASILSDFFSQVTCIRYEDSIELAQAEPLIEYILSCHGNQNQILFERYHEFKSFVEQRVKKGFHITKESGAFTASNKKSL